MKLIKNQNIVLSTKKMTLLKIAQFSSTFLMIGAIWIIQFVHYPAFKFIDSAKFGTFEAFHSQQITYFVGPVMLVELITAILLIYTNLNPSIKWFNVLSVVCLWIITVIVFIPIHSTLRNGFDLDLINKLIYLNWIRTFLWTIRGTILLFLFDFKRISNIFN